MGKNSISAWAPANISLIFNVYENNDPHKKGSYGLGFTLDTGVTVNVVKADKTEILFNGKSIDFPTVTSVINVFAEKVNITISSNLPLGCGFGLSGASALATSYALNELFNGDKTKLELAKIAHYAEVINHTGLGDVVNQYVGGFLLKLRPSSEFMVEKIPLTNIPVYCKVFSSLKTSLVISDKQMMRDIEKESTHALHEVTNMLQEGNVHLSQLLSLARKFVESTHLVGKEVKSTLEDISKLGGHGTMILLGNAVVSDIPFPGSTQYHIVSVGTHVM